MYMVYNLENILWHLLYAIHKYVLKKKKKIIYSIVFIQKINYDFRMGVVIDI